MSRYLIIILVFVFITTSSFSQEQRLTDKNTIGWLAYTGTFKIKPKVAIHTEYQWRRVDGFKNNQQNLFRTGVNYAIAKDVSLNAGYAFAKTFSYGDYPAANAFPEHRIYEQLVVKNPLGSIDMSHRFTLEQRFVGNVVIHNGEKNTGYVFLNRIRYRLKTEIPLIKKTNDKNNWSFILQDEVFIGWGKNIGANVFDQNRLAVLLGYKMSEYIKIEAGYLNQVLQQGKRINNKPVFQHNNGFMLSTHLSFDIIR